MEEIFMSNQEIQKQYEDYITSLTKYLNKIEYKAALFIHLNKKLSDKSEEVELVPVIFLPILESLLVDSIISLAKLYEERAERNLIKFLNFVEGNMSKITWNHQTMTHEELNKQKSLIDSHNKVMEVINHKRTGRINSVGTLFLLKILPTLW